jgi:hypothetical protein
MVFRLVDVVKKKKKINKNIENDDASVTRTTLIRSSLIAESWPPSPHYSRAYSPIVLSIRGERYVRSRTFPVAVAENPFARNVFSPPSFPLRPDRGTYLLLWSTVYCFYHKTLYQSVSFATRIFIFFFFFFIMPYTSRGPDLSLLVMLDITTYTKNEIVFRSQCA